MALISPGVEVTVSDESQYQPTAVGTVPLILVATAQDKTKPGGGVATGTTQNNAGKVVLITSQRELVSTFGTPAFDIDSAGNPVNASELSEYGLLAAYSALGVANRVYVQRANVDLAQLVGTSIRPTGTPADGIYWLDQNNTTLGVFEFDATTGGFVEKVPTTITNTTYISSGAPITSFGTIGEYAVVSTLNTSPIYYKRYDNTWVLVGTDAWKLSRPTVTGSIADPNDLAIGQKLTINGANITLTGTTVQDAADDITAALGSAGVIATVNSAGQIEIRADGTAASTGNVAAPDGKVIISSGTLIGGTDAASKLGLITGNSQTFETPTISFGDYRNQPAWRSTDAVPRPTGSVWFKTGATGGGANFAFKQYEATIDNWVLQAAPIYQDDFAALYDLDPTGGGSQLNVGTLYVKYDSLGDGTATFKAFIKDVTGQLALNSDIPTSGDFDLTVGDSFVMEVSVPGSEATVSATITVSDSGDGFGHAQSFVADILSANLPNISAIVELDGSITFGHLAGGTMKFTYVTGTVLADIGITGVNAPQYVQTITTNSVYLASSFIPLVFTYSATAPYSDPADGTLWYYNNPLEVDIMVHDGSGWKGYKNVSNDARGYNLAASDPLGPILSATRPTTQSDGGQLQAGDLWLNTADLENYPVIYRYSGTAWELIDNTDQISSDGILFADARWDINGATDPVTDRLTDIVTMQSSNYLDADAPDYRLYARGTLLFNTRRSGYNVKRFESAWHADATVVPTVTAAWVSHSGVNDNGVPYFGHWAQRNTIVEALKAAVEGSVALREEQVEFNLMACPGYPELIQNMITLNNDRKQTAFIIGDSPLTLNSSSTAVQEWISNANFAQDNGPDGLVSNSEYLAVYYPSGFATDLSGNSVVVPPSHMMLRTYIRSDNQSYPWFAPAGVRRGLIDNATSIGYVDVADSGTFKSIGVTVGLRDTLYSSRVNPLTVLPGAGLVAYGQKTRSAMTSSMDRVNVARLVCYLRLVLDKVARPFIFEPNDTITRNQVKSAFEAVLNDIVAKRGIYDYLVVCDETNNTPDRIDRNELYVDIAIEPVKAIEFVYIPVRLKNTGDIAAGL